ncbi:MAG: DUF1566 domain-containing protein [Thiothrix sp.]|uniref:Lcl domain-containing protein n=1 Tax=Thiothrix sp. TaxID=1032 RepID=UPI00262E9B3E|nr:DUF1566 domain-containing protein [Thiothrix sp.]MDD5393315.1 DUF1566 domain-containing protein [Thiothrix sp.]
MPKAFISYARDGSHGENLAAEIQQQLQAAGFAVFRDVIGLKPGDPWFHKLDLELESSHVMVLVLSEKVRTSTWVPSEVDMAKELGIPIVPVLAEKMIRPTWIRHLQALDFCGARDWRVLLEAIGHHVGEPSPPNPLSRETGEGEREVAVLAPRPLGGRGVGVRENSVPGRYIIHNNGTVTDTQTKLMWKRCSEGQSGADCSGEPASFTWDDAMSMFGKGGSFASYNDWRMPTIEELKTLVDNSQTPTIDQTAFPDTLASWYWSSTENGASFAWYVDFYDGDGDWDNRYVVLPVRLVRSGQ